MKFSPPMEKSIGKNMEMKHIKPYKIFENQSQREMSVIQSYYDCFADYTDLGMGVYFVDSNTHMIDIKNIDLNDKNINNQFNNMTFELRGFIDHEYENDPETLRNICDYLDKNLKSDENRFRKITGIKLKNTGMHVTMRFSDDENDLKEFIIKSKILDFNSKTARALFGRDHKGRNRTEYIKNFNEIPKNGQVINIGIVHEISEY